MDVLNAYVITYHDNRYVIDLNKSIECFEEQFPRLNKFDFFNVLHEGMEMILGKNKDSRGKFIIISKSKKFGIQLDWRRDTYNTEDKRNHGYTATTLDSETQKEVYRHDTKIFVEEFEKYGIAQWFETTDIEKMMEQMGYYAIEISECPGYKRYIKEGKMYANFEIIEVE